VFAGVLVLPVKAPLYAPSSSFRSSVLFRTRRKQLKMRPQKKIKAQGEEKREESRIKRKSKKDKK
jgi:hypothetical protein